MAVVAHDSPPGPLARQCTNQSTTTPRRRHRARPRAGRAPPSSPRAVPDRGAALLPRTSSVPRARQEGDAPDAGQPVRLPSTGIVLAEGLGFEPRVTCATMVFETI